MFEQHKQDHEEMRVCDACLCWKQKYYSAAESQGRFEFLRCDTEKKWTNMNKDMQYEYRW